MIEPTVGRVVWYYPGASDRAASDSGDQPCAALIAHVWSERCVNLAVFDAHGVNYSVLKATLLQDDDPVPDVAYAAWMPYQKGQAAKTEALEAKSTGL